MGVEHAIGCPGKEYAYRYRLHQTLVNVLDLEELITLCFYIGVDYDSLRGEGKAAKARELIKRQERLNKIPEIKEYLESYPWY